MPANAGSGVGATCSQNADDPARPDGVSVRRPDLVSGAQARSFNLFGPFAPETALHRAGALISVLSRKRRALRQSPEFRPRAAASPAAVGSTAAKGAMSEHHPEQGPPRPGSFLNGLLPEQRTALLQRGQHHRWRKGAVLCAQDEVSRWVALLTSGTVKASVHTREGTEILLGVQGPGALIGAPEAADGRPRTATVTALETAEAVVVPRASFLQFLRTHHQAVWLLVDSLCRQLRDADGARVSLVSTDIAGRLASLLADLAEHYGHREEGGLRISLPLTQHELASWIGASREAVSAALSSLRTRGWIETGRRTVVVRDLTALRDLACR